MSEPFLAEVRIVGFNFAPRGWAFCDGQILPINQNQSLFSIIGTTYGGDGRTSFALPDLRGRTCVHVGDGYDLSQKGGEEDVRLTAAQIPQHSHDMHAQNTLGDLHRPQNSLSVLAQTGVYADYTEADATTLRADTIGNTGGSQPHENMQPYITLSYCIALQGLFPSRN